MHPRAIVVCDERATYELKVGTVNYFKEIEHDHLDPESMLS
jgi:glucosamine-6-phosphate deaminase